MKILTSAHFPTQRALRVRYGWARLGADHPEVIEDQRMIEQLSLYQGVTDDEVEIARKELHDAGVEAP